MRSARGFRATSLTVKPRVWGKKGGADVEGEGKGKRGAVFYSPGCALSAKDIKALLRCAFSQHGSVFDGCVSRHRHNRAGSDGLGEGPAL